MARLSLKFIKPWHWALAAGIFVASIMVSGWFRCGNGGWELAAAIGVSLACGLLVFGLVRAKLTVWLLLFVLGMVFGLESAGELFLEQQFEKQCFVALATLGFWLVLFLVLGAMGEFIRHIHRLLHRIELPKVKPTAKPEPTPPEG